MNSDSFGGSRGLTDSLVGGVYVASNPTAGTGLVGHAAPTTYDTTKPYLLVYNSKPNVLVCPYYLRLTLTSASAGNTTMRFTQALDPSGTGSATTLSATRYSSGGTQLLPQNTRSDYGNACGALVYAGAVVATAASANARTLSTLTYRTVLGVAGDCYQLTWAAPELLDPAGLITTGTAIANVAFGYFPVVVAPGHCFAVHQWASSQSGAPTFEIEFSWAEFPIL